MLRRLTKVLPVIGVLIFIVLIFKIGPTKIIQSLISIRLVYLVPALLIAVPMLLLQAYKWNFLLKKQKITLKFRDVLEMHLAGVFYGFITPGRLGSLIRAYYVSKRTGSSLEVSGVSVLIDKFLDFLALFVIVLLGSLFLVKYFRNMLLITVLGFVLLVIGLFILTQKKLSEPLLRIFHNLILPARLRPKARRSFNLFYGCMLHKKQLIVPFALSFITWLIIYVQSYIVALAFGISISFFQFVVILSMATIISLIPITISGLGTREAALIALFSIYALAPELVFAFSISNYILGSVIPSAICALFALKMR